jgi:hypothetical protein
VQVFLSTHHPALLPVHNSYYRHEEMLELEAQAPQHEDINIADPILRFSRSLAAVLTEIHQARAMLLHRDLPGVWAASFLSMQNAHGGRWLTTSATTSRYAGVFFPDGDFHEALRQRLLIPFVSPSRGRTPCPCNGGSRIVNLVAEPCHPLICTRSRAQITGRHDAVRKLLVKLLRAVLPGVQIVEEPRPRQGEALLRHQPDIAYERGGIRYLIDVTVAEPTVWDVITDRALSSARVQGGAARQAEARKRREYGPLPEGVRLVPFAVEFTGNLGPAAADFLGLVAGDFSQPLKYFIRDLTITLAAFTGRLLSCCRSRIDS